MRLLSLLSLFFIFMAHLEARRDSRSRSSSSSGSRSSSSSSWGSSRSSSSYPTQSYGGSSSSSSSSSSRPSSSSSSSPKKSFGTKVKNTFGFGRKSPSSGSSSSSSSSSSYPKQSWGSSSSSSSSYPKQSYGSSSTSTGSGGSTYVAPKPAIVNTGTVNQGQPARTNYNQGMGAGVGGGYVGGGGFVAPKPVQNNAYSNQAPPSTAGGFVRPNPTSTGTGGYRNNNYGTGSNYNTGSTYNSGNNYNRGSNYNTGSTQTNAGSGYWGTAGAGTGAGILGARQSYGTYSNGQQSYGARAPGYGTNFGTNFNGGVGKYGSENKGFSKKALGLGVGAGFLGGAALGVGGTMATYSAVHKYQKFKSMMHERDQYHGSSMQGGNNWDNNYQDDYHRNYYQSNRCYEDCPPNSRCEYSFCECRYGFIKK